MAGRISQEIRTKVIREHLAGKLRDEIASETTIAEGSVSHILSEWKKGLQDPEYKDVRELAVQSRRLGMSLTDCATSFRLFNIFKKMKIEENRIESFILNIQRSCINAKEDEVLSNEKIVNVLMELLEISKSQAIPLQDVRRFVIEKIEQEQRLVENIQTLREQKQTAEIETNKATEPKGLCIQAINEHLSLKEELSKYSLSTKEIPKLCTILKHVNQLGYDPNKVVAMFSSIASLENVRQKIFLLKEEQKKHQNIWALCETLVISLQFGYTEVKLLADTISEIASRNQIPLREAGLKFFGVIKKYAKIEELELEITRLGEKIYQSERYLEQLNQLWQHKNQAVLCLTILYSRTPRSPDSVST
jgi:hypothetical protein